MLSGNLTILLESWQFKNVRKKVKVNDLALLMCRETDEEKWFMVLVEYMGSYPTILIEGDKIDGRDKATEGFMTRVEWLLWRNMVDTGKTRGLIE
jgi:hypothetical protein